MADKRKEPDPLISPPQAEETLQLFVPEQSIQVQASAMSSTPAQVWNGWRDPASPYLPPSRPMACGLKNP
jgi:hypothetical protein